MFRKENVNQSKYNYNCNEHSKVTCNRAYLLVNKHYICCRSRQTRDIISITYPAKISSLTLAC